MNKENQKNLKKCPPVVVVLGHVDHGKTTLLTAIKDFGVLEKEAGGITQHIGAYEIEHKNKKITFIDTPGHEAFEAMRSRGAKVADVAILVVDATQGVQAQTKEAIFYIKKRGLPLVVALNKMDLPQANPERIKDELAKLEIKVENRGGKIPALEISAKTGQGIEDLLEVIFLIAEIEEIKGDFSGKGQGVVIESYLNHKRGPTATLLVKNGILKKGDIVATNSVFGKVKILENFQGKPIEEAFPSMPVIVLGFEKVPQVGEEFKVFEDQEKAKEYIKESLIKKEKEIVIGPDQKVLNLIIKTDVAGSIEAVERVL
jgi:translation initiation factor IF-2